MNKTNYDAEMKKQIASLGGKRAKLLIHSCCAPCSSACLERLKDYFSITVLYYNPNIEDGEYQKRKAEQQRFLRETGWAEFLDCDHNTAEFYERVAGLEGEPEGGARCIACFKLRLEKTAELANEGGFDFFATTLTLSPLKNAEAINAIGQKLSEGRRAQWLFSDFKKANGYLRSIELSKEHALYRQSFCGCVFSQNERGQKVEKQSEK